MAGAFNSQGSDLGRGWSMELSNYELVRYPSGQLVLTRLVRTASGAPSSGPRDVIGVYTSEKEAQHALDKLAGHTAQPVDGVPPARGLRR
jgi:hypothetical protein